MKNIEKDLFEFRDLKYRDFHSGLMPGVNIDTIIGVRMPILKQYAKNLENYGEFLTELPHKYYEENNLHGLLISQIGDFEKCICELDRFLPFVDNWATCDMMKPRSFKKNREKLLKKINEWLKSGKTYTIRFAVSMLMTHFLDEDFDKRYLDTVAKIKSDEYYVNMMSAWFFATALAKHYDDTVLYIEKNILPDAVHNKAIQKAVESRRISEEKKLYLKTLRRK